LTARTTSMTPGGEDAPDSVGLGKNVAEKKGDHWNLKGEGEEGSSGELTTRHELYEKAKELDIEGRSAISKDELQKAVQRKE